MSQLRFESLENRYLLSVQPLEMLPGIAAQAAERAAPAFVPGEVLVGFRDEIGAAEIVQLYRDHGISELENLRGNGLGPAVRRLAVPEARTEQLIATLSQDPRVAYAEPNYIATAFWTPSDGLFGAQWNFHSFMVGASGEITNAGINMEAAWDIERGGDSSVIVAVIDTGVAYEDYTQRRTAYYRAPDLVNTHFVAGYDFVNNDSHPNDDRYHGTHVTGTIAQSTDGGDYTIKYENGVAKPFNGGMAGIAFATSIMPVKVLDRYGNGTYDNIAKGIYFAADNGANVINLSLGGTYDSATLRNAVQYAYEKGVTIVAAAGNSGVSQVSYPAAYDDYVIAVGATDRYGNLAYYSNYGSSLDIVAPGGDTRADGMDGIGQNTFNPWTLKTNDFDYFYLQGTSMAAPHVAGVAALIIANGNAKTPDDVREALLMSARNLGDNGWDATFGWGLLDADAALRYTPANRDPVAGDDSYTVLSGQTLSVAAPGVLGNDRDPNGDALTATLVTGPDSGLTLKPDGSFTYTPAAGVTGPVEFTYQVSDGRGGIALATVTINVADASARTVQLSATTSANKNTWTAKVFVAVSDALGPVTGAVVSGRWGNGEPISATTVNGTATFSSASLSSKTSSITFTVTAVDNVPYNLAITVYKGGTTSITSLAAGPSGSAARTAEMAALYNDVAWYYATQNRRSSFAKSQNAVDDVMQLWADSF